MMMKTRVQLSLFVLLAGFVSRLFLPSKEKQRLLVNFYKQLNVKTKKKPFVLHNLQDFLSFIH